MRSLAVLTALAIGAATILPAAAQDDRSRGRADLNGPAMDEVMLEARLNASKICELLKVDLRLAANWLGLPIPDILPFDTGVGFNANRHTVSRLERDGDRFETDIVFSCEPTSAVSSLAYLGISKESLRLSSEATCRGTIERNHRVTAVACDVDGRFGGYLAKYVDLSEKVANAVNGRLAVVDGFGAYGEGYEDEPGNRAAEEGESPFAEDQATTGDDRPASE